MKENKDKIAVMGMDIPKPQWERGDNMSKKSKCEKRKAKAREEIAVILIRASVPVNKRNDIYRIIEGI